MTNTLCKCILSTALLAIAAAPALAGDHKSTSVDPDDAYKNNCMRCHSEIRQYSPRMTATIVNHMRVRANLSAEETAAILEYLTGIAPEEPASKPAKRNAGKATPSTTPSKDQPGQNEPQPASHR